MKRVYEFRRRPRLSRMLKQLDEEEGEEDDVEDDGWHPDSALDDDERLYRKGFDTDQLTKSVGACQNHTDMNEGGVGDVIYMVVGEHMA